MMYVLSSSPSSTSILYNCNTETEAWGDAASSLTPPSCDPPQSLPSLRCHPQTAASEAVSSAARWWTPCEWASWGRCSAWSSVCLGLERNYSWGCWRRGQKGQTGRKGWKHNVEEATFISHMRLDSRVVQLCVTHTWASDCLQTKNNLISIHFHTSSSSSSWAIK